MNGVDILKSGLTNIRNNLPRVVIGRCLKCGTVRVIRDNDYTCKNCGTTMEDIDNLHERKLRIEQHKLSKNKKVYRKNKIKKDIDKEK